MTKASPWSWLLGAVGFLLALAPASAQTLLPIPVDGAPAVVVADETRLVMGTNGRVTESVRREVQVLDKAGQERYGTLVLGYDAFRRVRSLRGEVIDAAGERVRRLGKADTEDHPATSGYSLYDDNRVRVGRLYHDTFPYTLVWEYEVEHEGLLNWPSWRPQRYGDAVLRAALTVEVPRGDTLRFRPRGMDLAPEVTADSRTARYHWEGTFPAVTYEPVGPEWYDQLPALYLTTNRFEMDGHAGRLSNWAELGRWYDGLAVGRDDLPEEARADVEALVHGAGDVRERARLVYEYLQRNTRYVSVQLGIGGWQPFPASYVHERRYGDCKALTNYLQALLRAADVPAYPVLIGNGRPDLDPDFPRNAFNHVILYLPLADEPVWLEATSQTAPFGYLGAGSEGRWALLAEPGGGRLVRTPSSDAEANAQIRTSEVRLTAGGGIAVRSETRRTGHQLRSLRDALAARSDEEQRTWWTERLGLATESLNLAFDAEGGAVVAAFTAPRYAVRAGSRLLFRPNVVERWTNVPPPMDERVHPVEGGYAFADVDSVRITLPTGFEPEAVPDPVRLEKPFGSFSASVEPDGDGGLLYVRRVELHARSLPPESYADYRAFIAAIVRADEAQVILRRL